MKCMMSVDGKKIIRVNNERASELYSEGFKYVPKTMWKEKIRDVEKEPTVNKDTGKTEMVSKKSNEMSKAQKRHARKSNK